MSDDQQLFDGEESDQHDQQMLLCGQFTHQSTVSWMDWLPGMDLLAVASLPDPKSQPSSSGIVEPARVTVSVYRFQGRQQILINHEIVVPPTADSTVIPPSISLTPYGKWLVAALDGSDYKQFRFLPLEPPSVQGNPIVRTPLTTTSVNPTPLSNVKPVGAACAWLKHYRLPIALTAWEKSRRMMRQCDGNYYAEEEEEEGQFDGDAGKEDYAGKYGNNDGVFTATDYYDHQINGDYSEDEQGSYLLDLLIKPSPSGRADSIEIWTADALLPMGSLQVTGGDGDVIVSVHPLSTAAAASAFAGGGCNSSSSGSGSGNSSSSYNNNDDNITTHALDILCVSLSLSSRLRVTRHRLLDGSGGNSVGASRLLNIWYRFSCHLATPIHSYLTEFKKHCEHLQSLYSQQLAKTNRYYLRLLEQSLEEQGADSSTPTLEMVGLMATGIASPALIEFLGTHLTHKGLLKWLLSTESTYAQMLQTLITKLRPTVESLVGRLADLKGYFRYWQITGCLDGCNGGGERLGKYILPAFQRCLQSLTACHQWADRLAGRIREETLNFHHFAGWLSQAMTLYVGESASKAEMRVKEVNLNRVMVYIRNCLSRDALHVYFTKLSHITSDATAVSANQLMMQTQHEVNGLLVECSGLLHLEWQQVESSPSIATAADFKFDFRICTFRDNHDDDDDDYNDNDDDCSESSDSRLMGVIVPGKASNEVWLVRTNNLNGKHDGLLLEIARISTVDKNMLNDLRVATACVYTASEIVQTITGKDQDGNEKSQLVLLHCDLQTGIDWQPLSVWLNGTDDNNNNMNNNNNNKLNGVCKVQIQKRTDLPAPAQQCRVSSERGTVACCVGDAGRRVLMFDLSS